jgi:hypothetical protein
MASKNKEWFCQLLTVNDTFKEDGSRIITDEDIESEREAGMPEELIQQEFFCSWGASVVGAYYTSQLKLARDQRRIGFVPIEPEIPVSTAWDLGVNDTNAIWFFQEIGLEVRLIDYYENSGEGLPHYLQVLREKGYEYKMHYLPHDIRVREYTNGKSREDVLKELGVRNYTIVPSVSIDDGIEAARRLFSRCFFDEVKCNQGIKCLQEYHKEWDDKNKCFRNRPYHNWASNGSDAFRMLAVGIKSSQQTVKRDKIKPLKKIVNFLTGEVHARTPIRS